MEIIEALGIAGIPAIAVICYFAGVCAKALPVPDKYIPVICGTLGGVLGVTAMYIMPEFPARDHILALATGIVSGLGATGINQVFKQLNKTE